MPGKAGSSAGWTLMTRWGKRSRNAGSTSCMYPASTTSSAPAPASQSAIATSRAARSACSPAGNARTGTFAARARSSARASGLSEPTATTSMPARPWTRSRIACRFDPSPEARTPTFTRPPTPRGPSRATIRGGRGSRRLQHRVVPAAGLQRAGVEQGIDPFEHGGTAQVAERAVVRQAVPAVLEQDLRAPAAQDLDRARAAERRAREGDDLDDRLVERPGLAGRHGTLRELARTAAAAGGRPGRRRGERGVADVAARHVGRRHLAVAEVAQDALPPARGALDPRPHGPVLPPARAGALLRGRPAERERAAVPRADHPAHHPIGRRRARLDDADPGEVAHDRADDLLVAAREARDPLHRHIEPPRLAAGDRRLAGARRRAGERTGHRLERRLLHGGSLDEEHVQALVPR